MHQKKIDKIMLETAKLWSKMSKCKRSQVGAVIAKDERIISIGYNGLPSKFEPDSCENESTKIFCNFCKKEITKFITLKNEEIFCPFCKRKLGKLESVDGNLKKYSGEFTVIKKCITNPQVIHAEANAILFCAKNGISTKGCTLYVTMSPCIECAKMIIQAGIKRVVFENQYRKDEGIKLLQSCGIEIK